MEITEQAVRQILKSASGRIDFTHARPDDSFRKAGMDSMEISNIMLEIEEAYGVKIPDSDLDGLDTIEAIVGYVRTRKTGS